MIWNGYLNGNMKLNKLTTTIIIGAILAIVIATAQTESPLALQKIQEYNQQYASDVLQNVSFIIAFLAGILTLLSPCILPLVPAFFAYTFKEKREITKMTVLFFIGFTVIFSLLGLIASELGIISTASFQTRIPAVILIAGVLMVGLGISTILGFGFSGFRIKKEGGPKSLWGVILFGGLFALGWTACVGPILSGVLLMSSVFQNYLTALFLMVSYSLGIFVPLLIISLLYDKYGLKDSRFIKGSELNITFFGKTIRINSVKLISGLLLIFMGVIFIIFRGTSIVNTFDPLHTKQLFYDFQNVLLNGGIIYNVLGAIVLIIVVIAVIRMLKLKKNKGEKNGIWTV